MSRTGPKTDRLTILRAVTHEKVLGDHDFCLNRSHYTDTDPINQAINHRPGSYDYKINVRA